MFKKTSEHLKTHISSSKLSIMHNLLVMNDNKAANSSSNWCCLRKKKSPWHGSLVNNVMELSSQLGRLELGAAVAVSAETSHLLKLHIAATWHVDWRERADFTMIKINYELNRTVELAYTEIRRSTGGYKHQNDNLNTDYDIKYGASTYREFCKFKWQHLHAEHNVSISNYA